MALDGTDPQFHNDIWGYDTVLDGTWQYYIDPDFSKHLFRAKLDGSEAACIYDQSVGNLRIAGNYLFFYDYDDGYFKSYDLSTGEVLQLTPDPANCAVITKEGVYAASGNLQLEFIPLTSIGVKKLTQEWVDKINVAGNKIFYYNQDDYTYYIMNLDGTGKMKT